MRADIDKKILRGDEEAAFALRTLYSKYGYRPYKMSKFEEYDLYVENKDFLLSDRIITFNDTDGKLMALKPDVTLSIIKNSKDDPGKLHKVCYNENVYRVSGGAHTFKEIMQAGLECIGDIDIYSILEVVSLAVMSLETIGRSCRLDISHMGFISALTSDLPQSVKNAVLACVKNKSIHGIKQICEENGVDETVKNKLSAFTSVYGRPDEVLPSLLDLCGDDACLKAAYDELCTLCSLISSDSLSSDVYIDMSVINDMNYYSGVVFQGFVEGVPCDVLTGGCYDRLMNKMGRRAGGIGFAVYLDLLRDLDINEEDYDIDTLLLYDSETDTARISQEVKRQIESGCSVSAQKTVPENLRFRRIMRITERGLEKYEENA